MIRLAELAVFLVPMLAVVLWFIARSRGLQGPPPRQLAFIFAALVLLGAALSVMASRDKLPPGLYVPAQMVNGRIVPGHTQ